MTWMKAMLIAGGLGIAAVSAALGCGGFGMPREHFDGVNRYGYATWWAPVGTLDLGDGVLLPLVAGFQSDREWSSPVLGKGWILALTDSSLVALDERTFRWIMPDGQLGYFYRDKTTPTLLDGGKGWKGEIQDAKGETVTLSASCGTRYVYRKGKLASMTTSKNRTLQWLRAADGALREIREGGRTHLKVEIAPARDVDRALVFSGQRLEISWGERPRVGVAGADRAVTRIASAASSSPSASLSSFRVTLPLSFAYGFDAKHRPTFTVAREGEPPRVLAWDPQTRRIATDGEWTYAITPGEDLTAHAAIERKKAHGQTEFWHRDAARGREIETDTNGVTRTTTWFVYGKLAGKIRKITETANQQTQLVLQRTYDEQGRFLRETQRKGAVSEVTNYEYGTGPDPVAAFHNGVRLWTKRYDGFGREVFEEKPHSHRRFTRYFEGGNYEVTTIPAVPVSEAGEGGESRWDESRKEIEFHDVKGMRRVVRKASGETLEVQVRLLADGRLIRTFRNGVLSSECELDHRGRDRRRTRYGPGGNVESVIRWESSADERERRMVETDRDGNRRWTLIFRYDEQGRVIEFTAPEGTYYSTYAPDGKRTQRFVPVESKNNSRA